jgi:ATP-binding cassette subfamily F protein 3
MDIESKEVFEEALIEFSGTAIIISHDRYFLQRIPDRILELTPDGIVEYLGKYDYYIDKKSEIQSGKKYIDEMSKSHGEKASNLGKTLSSEEQRRLNKKAQSEERRLERRKKAIEEEMSQLEEKMSDIEAQMCNPENALNYELLAGLGKQLDDFHSQYDTLMEEWLSLE